MAARIWQEPAYRFVGNERRCAERLRARGWLQARTRNRHVVTPPECKPMLAADPFWADPLHRQLPNDSKKASQFIDGDELLPGLKKGARPLMGNSCFVNELPLRVNRAQRHALDKRFDVAHLAYNVVLGDLLSAADAMRRDPRYHAARQIPKGSAERAKAFQSLWHDYRLSSFDAQDIARAHVRASKWLAPLLDSHVVNALADRAFAAVEQYLYGKRGRPRFKRCSDIASVEGKQASSPLRWTGDRLVWGSQRRDRALVLRPVFDKRDCYGVQAHALASTVKYARLLRRKVKGEWAYFVQLVLVGEPMQKYVVRERTACIDLGPSNAAVVSHENAALVSLLPTLEEDTAEVRRLRRHMDRSQRATNPNSYDEAGRAKRGCRWVKSKRYGALEAKLAEHERVFATRRNRAQGRLSNIVLAEFGRHVRTEKLSRKAWQRLWGRRMKATAPAMLMEKLRYKAENAGGELFEFSPAKHRLSQYDHAAEDYVRKPLSLRVHTLRDGSGRTVQRDLYSAWLGLFVQADGFDAPAAQAAFEGAHPLLMRAASKLVKAASWGPLAPARPLEDGRAARASKQQESRARPAEQLAAEESAATL